MSTLSTPTTSPDTAAHADWLENWNAWTEQRDAAVFAPWGVASLAATHWLTGDPQVLEGLPGTWSDRGGVPHVSLDELHHGLTTVADGDRPGRELAPGLQTLAPGERWALGDLRLVPFVRAGAAAGSTVALRVLDPAAPTRAGLTGIGRFAPDPSYAVAGRFTAHGDGTGVVRLVVGKVAAELTVRVGEDGLHAVLADGTSGSETYRFRFLEAPLPDADGAVTIDFNRTYLPPCAFADSYVCPLPPPGNRWTIPLRAGESLPRRT